ncbi:MAG: 5'-3' exonuclease H3TH domain-containing protein, partial [Planctomycetota bacterium]
MTKIFCIVDGTAQIYRSFYAIKGLTTSKGFPTNAIYGFVNILNKISKDIKFNYICVVFDSPKPNFRHKLHPAYKATRAKPSENLIIQIEKIKEITKSLGINILQIDGWEADDIIATIVEKFSQQCEFIVVSSDKDIMQLVKTNVKILDTKTNEYYTEKEVEKKLGIKPESIPGYLAIVGDNVDNIPGIVGIGPKKAIEILKNHQSLEQLLTNPETIPKYKDILIQNKNLLLKNLELVKLKIYDKFSYTIDDFIPKPP